MKKSGKISFDKKFQIHFLNLKEMMQKSIKQSKLVYPSPEEQEKIIEKASNTLCSWRMMIDMATYTACELHNSDSYFPFIYAISVEELLMYIHPSYLFPYLLCAEFAYTFTIELNIPIEQIPDYAFQVSVPFKFPGDKDYHWYTQVSNTVSLNEEKIILSHISVFYYEKQYSSFEYRLIQPSVLKKGKLFHSLHEGLLDKVRLHISNTLTTHEKKVVLLYAKGYKLKAVAGEMGTTEGTERARNNTILKKTKEILGFKFTSIADLADFFHHNRILTGA